MRKLILLLVATSVVIGAAFTIVWAGGDKNQNERGADTAPGPGDDAQGNQAGGD